MEVLWEQAMLAGRSIHIVGGDTEVPWPIQMPERIASGVSSATMTSHAIVVEKGPTIWRGGWKLGGGLLGRVEEAGGSVELFGKANIRLHWPYDAKIGSDYSWDFFLVVRPQRNAPARVVRRWHFNPEEGALVVPPATAADIREFAKTEDEAMKRINKQKSHYLVAGYLKFDPNRHVATVTITGMVRCVEEHVDVASFLARSKTDSDIGRARSR